MTQANDNDDILCSGCRKVVDVKDEDILCWKCKDAWMRYKRELLEKISDLEDEIEKLKEGGNMTTQILPTKMNDTEFSEFYDDAVAFIEWSRINDRPSAFILSTLIHDISGIVRNERHFQPRVSGYAKVLANANKGGK